MAGLYVFFCSGYNHVVTETQTHSDAAGPSTVNKTVSSSQKAINRQPSSVSRKSSSTTSTVTSASKNSASQKFAPSTCQQRNVKASMNVLVSYFVVVLFIIFFDKIKFCLITEESQHLFAVDSGQRARLAKVMSPKFV